MGALHPWVPADDPIFDTVGLASTDDLARSCDIVTLHAPGGQTVVDEA